MKKQLVDGVFKSCIFALGNVCTIYILGRGDPNKVFKQMMLRDQMWLDIKTT